MQTISSSGCNSSLWLGSPVATSPPCALQDLSCLFLWWWHYNKAPNILRGLWVFIQGFHLLLNLECRSRGERISSHSWRRIQIYNFTWASLNSLRLLWMWIFITCALTATPQMLAPCWPHVCSVCENSCVRACVRSLVLNVIFLSAGVVWWNFRKKSRKKVGQEPMGLCLRSDWARRQTSKNFSGKKMGAVKKSKRV